MTPSRHGFLLVDKPAGPTSHDVVQAARRALRERRIGHTGTLDPAATGLLLLCIGKATRLQSFMLTWEKTYEGEIALGIATTTYDTEGEPLGPRRPVPALDEAQLAGIAARFSGTIEQLPPPYSAKKLAGRKLYELARAGEQVPLEPKTVTVHELRLELSAPDRLRFSVTCSSGTYVRSLAHDMGEVLGCGGHLASLRRVRIGPWLAADAVSGEALANRPHEIPEQAWVSLRDARLPFGEVTLNPTALAHFGHGQEVVVREVEGSFPVGGQVAVRDRAGELVGIGVAVAFMPRARTLTVAPRMVLGALETA
ncbi:MAG TPA: tRNA pseudouridine(55) synthase TruB [Thermoanaerobaculaceae bacterium]|nr:tRNA pseudouridine(55) synthase TruB [Thermoanaerobaculaceae bacterium]HRS17520.1 tRNA pseudouridine(55) synthase TruB [Thermoanaerobaculaceae bacterium]